MVSPELAKILQAPATAVEHQYQGQNMLPRSITGTTAGLRQLLVQHPQQAEGTANSPKRARHAWEVIRPFVVSSLKGSTVCFIKVFTSLVWCKYVR